MVTSELIWNESGELESADKDGTEVLNEESQEEGECDSEVEIIQQPSENQNVSGTSTGEGETEQPTTQNLSDTRKTGRQRQEPVWMKDYIVGNAGFMFSDREEEVYAMFIESTDPENFEDAVKEEVWRRAMETEIASIEDNNTWELVTAPEEAKIIGVKWIFKTKFNEKGEIDKFKARLVAKGYCQQQGVDYYEVFAPVARWDTIRLILSLAAEKKWKVYQMDVKSAFLHGELEENVYIEQPKGFIVKGKEEKVYKLRKALYGLKQAPRAWYSRIESYFLTKGFQKCYCEHTLFVKEVNKEHLIVSIYVDDLIYTGRSSELMSEFKESMMQEFAMTDLGMMKFFLGVEITQDEIGIFINQRKYAEEVLSRYGMTNSNAVKNPIVPGHKMSKNGAGKEVDPTSFKQLIGSLRYLTVTRPDLLYSVNLVSRFMESPKEQHMCAAKRILRYVRGTTAFGIQYKTGGEQKLVGYVDSDYAGDEDDRRSTSGYVFMMGAGAISWASKKQPIVTLSTTEAEFVSAAYGACQAVWLRNVLEKLGSTQENETILFCDNSSTIKLSMNPVLHGRSKHIHVRFHFLRELVKEGTLKLEYCSTQVQLADIMTKAVKLESFVKLRDWLGVDTKK